MHTAIAQQAKPLTVPQKKHSHKAASQDYFTAYGDKVKFVVYHTDSITMDSGGPYVTSTAEYIWDTINSGYIFVIKEQRLFCNEINPAILQGDIKNLLGVIPKNGFRLLDKTGGEFYVDIEEALYDGGADSIFVAVDINGFIGGDAQFEERGVVGMKYKELVQYNDSLYKRPDQYPMNRFGKPLQLR
ncbi:MAG: hypothetical protein ACLQQ4_07805 [Bacteroidia bacterium]